MYCLLQKWNKIWMKWWQKSRRQPTESEPNSKVGLLCSLFSIEKLNYCYPINPHSSSIDFSIMTFRGISCTPYLSRNTHPYHRWDMSKGRTLLSSIQLTGKHLYLEFPISPTINAHCSNWYPYDLIQHVLFHSHCFTTVAPYNTV